MNAPLFTIVIPTLNRAHCVGRAIDSALAQTWPNLEIIVSDNGSTDATPEVLARYADPRLRILRRDDTIPAPEHGNFLIESARGAYFLGLSDDDYLEPGFVAAVMARFLEDPEVVIAYTRCLVHYWEFALPTSRSPRLESGRDFLVGHYAQHREVCWCACALRMAELRGAGPLPPGTLFGDMYLWTRIALSGKVAWVDRALSHYVLFDPATMNTCHSTPVREWGDQAAALAESVLQRLRALGAAEALSAGQLRALRARMKRYVANSVANQFVWLALRGARRGQLLEAAFEVWGRIGARVGFWPHVCLGIAAPRRLLAALVRRTVRRRCEAARAGRPPW